MSLLFLMEELGFLSGEMAYLGKMGSHHGWCTQKLRYMGSSKNVTGDQSRGTSKEVGTLSETCLEDLGVPFCFPFLANA